MPYCIKKQIKSAVKSAVESTVESAVESADKYPCLLVVMIGDGRGTEDGLELHMQVNHLGHFLLTLLLEHNLLKAAEEKDSDVRIINVSSDGHKFTLMKGLDIDNER